MKSKFDFLQIKYKTVSSVKELVDSKQKAALCIISGLKECTDEEKEMLSLLSVQRRSVAFTE